MHVVEQVAVKGPVAGLVGGEVEACRAARLDHHRVLERLVHGVGPVDQLEEMSVPEVADAIGINLNTVYSRLRAARRDFDAAVARHHARERSGQ